jgi:hypothetical protein
MTCFLYTDIFVQILLQVLAEPVKNLSAIYDIQRFHVQKSPSLDFVLSQMNLVQILTYLVLNIHF